MFSLAINYRVLSEFVLPPPEADGPSVRSLAPLPPRNREIIPEAVVFAVLMMRPGAAFSSVDALFGILTLLPNTKPPIAVPIAPETELICDPENRMPVNLGI